MIEQRTIKQQQLEAQISFLQLTLASLQARQDTSLELVDGPEPMTSHTTTPEAGATLLDMPLPIAAG